MTALLVFVLVLIFSSKLIKFIENKINSKFNSEYVKYGFLSRYYLSSRFTDREFQEWCKYFLKNMHYRNLKNVSENFEGGISFISTNNKNPTYISTRLYQLKDSEKNKQKKNVDDSYKAIGRPEVQKFVGALVHDRVKSGVIITTGDFTQEAIEYVRSLPKDYLIVLIDGAALTKELRKIRKREITSRVASGLIG